MKLFYYSNINKPSFSFIKMIAHLFRDPEEINNKNPGLFFLIWKQQEMGYTFLSHMKNNQNTMLVNELVLSKRKGL